MAGGEAVKGVAPLSVSVVLPTYNERDNVTVLIPEIEEAFAGIPLEIVVADDSSPDGTGDAVQALNARFGNVRLVTRPRKEGLGAAIHHGLDEATHDVLITSDADKSFQATDMLRLYRKIEEGYDLVVGSRHSQGSRYDATSLDIKMKYAVSRMGNRGLGMITGLAIHDFSANFRAIRRRVWCLLAVNETTNSILVEMILKAAYGGARVIEIPVSFGERLHGESKLSLTREAPRFMVKLCKYVAMYRFTGYRLPRARALQATEENPGGVRRTS